MATTDDYRDVRAMLDGFERETCPECGVERWFRRRDDWEWADDDRWTCQRCGEQRRRTLEYPCPECGTRMLYEGDRFTCMVCSGVGEAFVAREIDRDALVDRLTGEFAPAAGYQHGTFQPCPVCGERSILNGPDGERECRECGDFYAPRFGAEWFCYAIWLSDPERIRVGTEW